MGTICSIPIIHNNDNILYSNINDTINDTINDKTNNYIQHNTITFRNKDKLDNWLLFIKEDNYINSIMQIIFNNEFSKLKNLVIKKFKTNLINNKQSYFMACGFIDINKCTTIYYIRKYFYNTTDDSKLSDIKFNSFINTMNKYCTTDLFTIKTGSINQGNEYFLLVKDKLDTDILLERIPLYPHIKIYAKTIIN